MSKEFKIAPDYTQALSFKAPRPKTDSIPFHRFNVGETVSFNDNGIKRQGEIKEVQSLGYLIKSEGEMYWDRTLSVLYLNSHLVPREIGDDIYFTIGAETHKGTILSITEDTFTVETDLGKLDIGKEAAYPYKEMAKMEGVIKGYLDSYTQHFGIDMNKEIDDRQIIRQGRKEK